jgi:hypothetical protein
MTLNQIRAMFAVGEEWTADNTYNPGASGPRVLVEMRSRQFIWKTQQAERSFMQLPKASQIVETRDGFLSFKLFTPEEETKYRKPGAIEATLTLTRVCADCREAKRHAYSDATTPGFFYDRCEKHRKPSLPVSA